MPEKWDSIIDLTFSLLGSPNGLDLVIYSSWTEIGGSRQTTGFKGRHFFLGLNKIT